MRQESYLVRAHYDLVTPDGKITRITRTGSQAEVEIVIEGISPAFVGFEIDPARVVFNLKSTLAQLGVDSTTHQIELEPEWGRAAVQISLIAIGPIAEALLKLLEVGAGVGKLFAADERRRVRNPHYLLRMFGRSDRKGRPLLSLGGPHGSDDFVFEVIDGRTVAYLALLQGRLEYDEAIYGLLSTIAKGLKANYPTRELLSFHQHWTPAAPRIVEENKILLVKTLPLHIRTVFASVAHDLLPPGFRHTSASVLQPDTMHSGDVYEFHGRSTKEIADVPLEFYTLEPHREYVFFADRDQLQATLENPENLFALFDSAPPEQAALFAVKGEQLQNLSDEDWITRDAVMHELPSFAPGSRQAMMVARYIQKQPAYPFLEAIEEGLITSQGVLFTRYFPSPVLKRLLLSDPVARCLKGIYFERPSLRSGEFFSYEDRSMLLDLAKFAIPVYWVDRRTHQVLLYVPRPEKDCGMFVPLHKVNAFRRATFFGIYGSHLIGGSFTEELTELLNGILALKENADHPLLNPDSQIALVTGGGPGAMEVGNRVAKELGILSCANIVDFGDVKEQLQNPYIEAKMNYRIDKLVERQAEFHLDFPLFVEGGIGTDFEYALEEVRRKTGAGPAHPVLLAGDPDYWRQKITSRFQCNLRSGTITGSEWVSNAFFCVQSAKEALAVYRDFFADKLAIGPHGSIYEEGFRIVAK
ncbi:MAG: LOG family protein [Parachlamydiales bacterium]